MFFFILILVFFFQTISVETYIKTHFLLDKEEHLSWAMWHHLSLHIQQLSPEVPRLLGSLTLSSYPVPRNWPLVLKASRNGKGSLTYRSIMIRHITCALESKRVKGERTEICLPLPEHAGCTASFFCKDRPHLHPGEREWLQRETLSLNLYFSSAERAKASGQGNGAWRSWSYRGLT